MDIKIKPGDFVWFYYNGLNRYNKILKLVYTADGLCAIFEDKLCIRETYTIPIKDLYLNKEEYFKSRSNLTKN